MDIQRLPLTEEAARLGVSIIKQFSVRDTYHIHRHAFEELFFVSRGRSLHCVNGSTQLLEKGSLVLIRPDDAHSFSPINYFDFVMYSLGFAVGETDRAAAYLGLACPGGPLPPHAVLYGSASGGMERQLEALLRTRTPARLAMLRALLPQALLALCTPPAREAAAPIPPWLAALDEQMRRRENYVAGLPRLRALCGYSPEYLNRMFRLHMKCTPTEYVNALRMEYATELLVEGGRSVTDICYQTGFNNLSHFYAVFRRIYGCAPGEFLRRLG